jgi:hypothetical protein
MPMTERHSWSITIGDLEVLFTLTHHYDYLVFGLSQCRGNVHTPAITGIVSSVYKEELASLLVYSFNCILEAIHSENDSISFEHTITSVLTN